MHICENRLQWDHLLCDCGWLTVASADTWTEHLKNKSDDSDVFVAHCSVKRSSKLRGWRKRDQQFPLENKNKTKQNQVTAKMNEGKTLKIIINFATHAKHENCAIEFRCNFPLCCRVFRHSKNSKRRRKISSTNSIGSPAHTLNGMTNLTYGDRFCATARASTLEWNWFLKWPTQATKSRNLFRSVTVFGQSVDGLH